MLKNKWKTNREEKKIQTWKTK